MYIPSHYSDCLQDNMKDTIHQNTVSSCLRFFPYCNNPLSVIVITNECIVFVSKMYIKCIITIMYNFIYHYVNYILSVIFINLKRNQEELKKPPRELFISFGEL